ncbi:lipopolysaccharide assembly protein LapA domain-containing protein [Natranaerobius trueperi]|uniref:lipopolysaccharide assembly protein LapA domain-containing protein n=1 Tax=Natranaerobius trueperi TaxID=759412 RepID=UPI0013032FD3|nr:lipopolysaccharide assembly protein LapA domain-containing protein [Natranaerobius trueperi]
MKPKAIAIIVLIMLSLILLFQNTHTVELEILFWQVSAPLILLLLLCLIGGFLIGYLAKALYTVTKRPRM